MEKVWTKLKRLLRLLPEGETSRAWVKGVEYLLKSLTTKISGAYHATPGLSCYVIAAGFVAIYLHQRSGYLNKITIFYVVGSRLKGQ